MSEFSEYLDINSNLIIEIQGFTDNAGSSIDNQLLSEKRANSVLKYLLQLGVDKQRLSSVVYGEKNQNTATIVRLVDLKIDGLN